MTISDTGAALLLLAKRTDEMGLGSIADELREHAAVVIASAAERERAAGVVAAAVAYDRNPCMANGAALSTAVRAAGLAEAVRA